LFTFFLEALGAVILFLCFSSRNEPLTALYFSIFHSISAFCNAGFSLFSDSFAGYISNWPLNLTICFLIIAGGIGFPVLSEIRQRFSLKHPTWSRLSLHSKIVLSTTTALLLIGTLLILIMEWNNTLSPLNVFNRILAAFFHSVNARTSGFNTLPIGNMANQTLFVLISLMFIGASPGSCGGGIKTTTLTSLFILGMSRFRGQERPSLFGRTLSEISIGKAVSIFLISALIVCIGIMILLATELGDTPHPLSRGHYLELFFEVVSAFGTVGLSTGITSSLTTVGKLVITLTMFIGRLGPLVIAMAVSRSVIARYHFAEENIIIG
ncbi:MAG: ATPase, partial [Desulfobacterales bacterium]|nr:ATPase [Desulfobacterales bacterium]